jgi:hypothetical protein
MTFTQLNAMFQTHLNHLWSIIEAFLEHIFSNEKAKILWGYLSSTFEICLIGSRQLVI